jgi:arogenate dehydrogenase (NADP+)
MNIGIVGLGLIGGSLGLDFRTQGHRVLGVSRKAETCDRAMARGAVDLASVELALLQEAEVVFLCTPLAALPATVTQLIPHLQPGTILTDVGSVKGWVVDTIAPLWPNFVGGHPMAGTADSGIDAAQPDLFTGAAYVLTPVATTPTLAVQTIADLVQPLKTRLYQCSPDAHDQAVAWISHLPVISSASLIAACLSEANPEILALAQALASSGFRDTSRVGGGNPELGVMMARYNRSALLRSLQAYRDSLDHAIAEITNADWTAVADRLTQTHQARPAFTQHDFRENK